MASETTPPSMASEIMIIEALCFPKPFHENNFKFEICNQCLPNKISRNNIQTLDDMEALIWNTSCFVDIKGVLERVYVYDPFLQHPFMSKDIEDFPQLKNEHQYLYLMSWFEYEMIPDDQEADFNAWLQRKQKYDLVFSDLLLLGDTSLGDYEVIEL
ncbi:hypothetical protein K440DRAFT_645090 [Wilcoxina mikolae CBS 423.85]|nr:hypothetical protein K440DRAFT_645090 [Wilcoxina mikolae CBS 423.85]